MRILVVSQYYYPEPFRINEICEELVRRGHEVTVLTANPNYPDGEIYEGYSNNDHEEAINGVKVIRCKCRPRHKGAKNLALNYISFVIHANKEIEQINCEYDCVYVYQLSPVTSCIPAIKFKKQHHIPLFLYCLDIWPESLKGTVLAKRPFFQVMKYISKKIYMSADKIAVTSPTFISYLSDNFGIKAEKIKFVPQHSSEISWSDSDFVNQKYKNSHVTNFIFMGNIGEAQNLECLIKAISFIKDRRKFLIHIVGSGSHYNKCVNLTNELGVSDTVIFHGRHPKSDMFKFYLLADVCYVSLKDEGVVGCTIPGKVQEYMSVGKPILACMNGDTSEIINNAECGVCVPADDAIQLSRAIVAMSNHKVDLKKMGQNARKYYCENYTIISHVDRIELLMGELVR